MLIFFQEFQLHPSMQLDKTEALKFITDVLGVSSPLRKLEQNRLLFLNELVKAFSDRIPFQNVTLLSQPPSDRHVPTWEEIKTAVMESRRGLCYTLGVFINILLEALNYDTYFAAGAIFSPNNHIITIVKDLSFAGSKHLVDVNGYPSFEAIPLDFKHESPIYYHAFLEYKFIKEGSKIFRFHRKGEFRDLVPGREYDVDGWRRLCEVDLTPRDLSFFKQAMTDVYTIPGKNTPFLVSFRATIYKDLKLAAIKDNTLLLENDKHEIETSEISNQEEMIKTINKYFPNLFTIEEITKAIDYLKLYK